MAQQCCYLRIRMQQKFTVEPLMLLQESRSPTTTSVAKYLKCVLITSVLGALFLMTVLIKSSCRLCWSLLRKCYFNMFV